MARRSPRMIVLAPIVVYLAAMALLAVFVLHPPTLGWIGLAALAVAALAVGLLAVALLPRLGENAVRVHPRTGELFRLLIVADTEVEPSELVLATRLRLIGRRAEVRVVCPLMATPLHFLAGDEGREQTAADRRLCRALEALAAAGIESQGSVGTDDPVQAAADLLPAFPADEILFVGPLAPSRGWLEQDFERRARDLLGVPVSTVFGLAAASSPLATAI